METVKTLLLSGASATVRTRQGALPYHLACIPEIRSMLESMGGAEAVPAAGDKIDMLQVLTELTMPSEYQMGENDCSARIVSIVMRCVKDGLCFVACIDVLLFVRVSVEVVS